MKQFKKSGIIESRIENLTLGLVTVYNARVEKSGELFDSEFLSLKDFLNEKFASRRPAEDAVVGHVRRMYRAIGWEPTKYRPSSEALIRRILREKDLYRINNLVDFGNLASARFHLPMGLYDCDKVVGSPRIDVGQSGETYQGISKPLIHAEGKLILRDDRGIFGNPTADSARTAISSDTKTAMAVFFCPPEVEEDYIERALDYLSEWYRHFSRDGKVEGKIDPL